jgi:hypothetical protein
MTGVMANDKETSDGKACGQGTNEFGPPSLKNHCTRQKETPNAQVKDQQKNRIDCGALRQRDKPLANHLAVGHRLVYGNRCFYGFHRSSGHDGEPTPLQQAPSF